MISARLMMASFQCADHDVWITGHDYIGHELAASPKGPKGPVQNMCNVCNVLKISKTYDL